MASKQEHQLDSRSLLPFRLVVSSGSYGRPCISVYWSCHSGNGTQWYRAKPTGKRGNRRTMTANGEPEIHEFRGVSSCWNNGNLSASARVFPVGLGRERLSWCTCLINSSSPLSSYNSGDPGIGPRCETAKRNRRGAYAPSKSGNRCKAPPEVVSSMRERRNIVLERIGQ